MNFNITLVMNECETYKMRYSIDSKDFLIFLNIP